MTDAALTTGPFPAGGPDGRSPKGLTDKRYADGAVVLVTNFFVKESIRIYLT